MPSSCPLFTAMRTTATTAATRTAAMHPRPFAMEDGLDTGTPAPAPPVAPTAPVANAAPAPAPWTRMRSSNSWSPTRARMRSPFRQAGMRSRAGPFASRTGRMTPWAACWGVIVMGISCDDTGCSKG